MARRKRVRRATIVYIDYFGGYVCEVMKNGYLATGPATLFGSGGPATFKTAEEAKAYANKYGHMTDI